jgi:uncharacterized membrane protein YbjE (DUF340 family)
MSNSGQNQPQSPDEQKFIQRAMADIDKAEKVQKIKQVVVIGVFFGALIWLAIRTPGPGLNNAFVILVVAIGIARILFRIDSSTRAILRAIANRQ